MFSVVQIYSPGGSNTRHHLACELDCTSEGAVSAYISEDTFRNLEDDHNLKQYLQTFNI